ncbi:glycosyltransferase family 2 protein [Rhizobium sp. CFBP 8762]|uniref:glycosyltransferase family 2 protein n=1 Tax=Rhizobium sp. CFBP 8762 TaxID=2775279 RepID=UPI001FD14001|nr:glycosyltransferase family 2 protein [Rhizobium sp. CFBP 8762]
MNILSTIFKPKSMKKLAPLLESELLLLQDLGIDLYTIALCQHAAAANGTSLYAELIAGEYLDETRFHAEVARKLGLPFIPNPDPACVQDLPGLDTQLAAPQALRMQFSSRAPLALVALDISRFTALSNRLKEAPVLRKSMAITTPSAIRAATWAAGSERRARQATKQLFESKPKLSSRIVFWGRQGFYAGLSLGVLLLGIFTAPILTLMLIHIVLTNFFLAGFCLRLSAMRRSGKTHGLNVDLEPWDGPFPTYTVLVALYREAPVVEQLVTSLNALNWPKSCLDIKLICEADDTETLQAFRSMTLGSQFEIVEVPFSLPRTKPKALSYALAGARGDFITVYDAEDRPHPDQLREAFQHFRTSPVRIACLQAPLVITNARASWISALFAIEYSGLFRGLLPLLSATERPLPLGGTSNHFRTKVLKEVGGWDPYNVTEDADLGIRLFRYGYRSKVIRLPTYEDAPTDARAWVNQRSRWFKGWLQTWLVTTREPKVLYRDMGVMNTLIFQVLIGGMLLSALSHPLLIVFIGFAVWLTLTGALPLTPMAATLFSIDTLNIFGSYLVFTILGLDKMSPPERRAVGRRWLLVGPYWMLMSYAAWKALIELFSKPFAWNKTAHQPTRSKDFS